METLIEMENNVLSDQFGKQQSGLGKWLEPSGRSGNANRDSDWRHFATQSHERVAGKRLRMFQKFR